MYWNREYQRKNILQKAIYFLDDWMMYGLMSSVSTSNRDTTTFILDWITLYKVYGVYIKH